MIKVNLLKDAGKRPKSSIGGDSTILDSDFKTSLGGSMGDNQALIKRAIFALVPIILVFVYTWYVEHGLKSHIDTLNGQIKNTDAQIAALKPELDVIEKLKSEKNKITTEVNTIKELSKKRYLYVKILESMQNLIPEKAWITKMDVKDQTVSIEGRATEDSVISSFMQSLEESAYFSNVTWIDSREVSEPQGVVKSFSIRFSLENI
jgi:type IV pilus assembly protein PilN